MILLIAGTTHTGKTFQAQNLLEKYKYPYLSLDHLKMGLIRSGYTSLTPEDDDLLTEYLWPVVREIIKTAVENNQNLIVEGCYIPFDWQKDFTCEYLKEIKYTCLIMSSEYIENNFGLINANANVIETRIGDCIEKEELIEDNAENLRQCKKYGLDYTLIDGEYIKPGQLFG